MESMARPLESLAACKFAVEIRNKKISIVGDRLLTKASVVSVAAAAATVDMASCDERANRALVMVKALVEATNVATTTTTLSIMVTRIGWYIPTNCAAATARFGAFNS
jgi:hypothetical protein